MNNIVRLAAENDNGTFFLWNAILCETYMLATSFENVLESVLRHT